jgi:hypothetical protein
MLVADTLFSRYLHGGDGADIAQAVTVAREAVDSLPSGTPNRVIALVSLAELLHAQFQRDGRQEALDDAMRVVAAAADAAPRGASVWARAMSCQASLLRELYLRDPSSSVADQAIELWRAAAASVSAPNALRLDAAASWAEFAVSLGDWPAALSGYRTAMGLLPLLSWRGAAPGERALALGRYAQLGQDAAACALNVGIPELALELLEHARGLFWAEALDTRADLARLRAVAPDLAARLEAVRARLDAPEQPPLTPGVAQPPLARAAQERYSLAREWEDLVASVRTIAGFDSFLRPAAFAELRNAAKEGPVAVINVSRLRCDALVLTRHGVSVLELRESYEEIAQAAVAYYESWRRTLDPAGLEAAARQTGDILAWLWREIVQPILDGLSLAATGEEPLPRLWWCPTGPLTALPLHAAGIYAPVPERDESAMYRVCSSYTPTLRALISARRIQLSKADDGGLLIVSPSSAPRYPDLPAADEEIAVIQGLFGSTPDVAPPRVLVGNDATRAAVLAAVADAPAVHFIGHAIQRASPAESGLLVADGFLTVEAIAALNQSSATFAYLSACDTARPEDALPDVVTLAASIHVSGYRNVIAALGVVPDREAAIVDVDVYRRLISSRGYVRAEGSAQALHAALRGLLSVSPDNFLSCSAFIHIGP